MSPTQLRPRLSSTHSKSRPPLLCLSPQGLWRIPRLCQPPRPAAGRPCPFRLHPRRRKEGRSLRLAPHSARRLPAHIASGVTKTLASHLLLPSSTHYVDSTGEAATPGAQMALHTCDLLLLRSSSSASRCCCTGAICNARTPSSHQADVNKSSSFLGFCLGQNPEPDLAVAR